MFPNQFKIAKAVVEEFKIVENVVDLIYLTIFDSISLNMVLDMRKECVFLTKGCLRFLYKGSSKCDRQK